MTIRWHHYSTWEARMEILKIYLGLHEHYLYFLVKHKVYYATEEPWDFRGRKCQTCLGKADVLLGLLFMLLLNVLYVVFKRNWRHGCHWTKCNLLILCITEEYFCSPKRNPRNLTWADWEGTISKWAVYVAQKYWRHLAPAKAIWNISICTQILTRKKC